MAAMKRSTIIVLFWIRASMVMVHISFLFLVSGTLLQSLVVIIALGEIERDRDIRDPFMIRIE